MPRAAGAGASDGQQSPVYIQVLAGTRNAAVERVDVPVPQNGALHSLFQYHFTTTGNPSKTRHARTGKMGNLRRRRNRVVQLSWYITCIHVFCLACSLILLGGNLVTRTQEPFGSRGNVTPVLIMWVLDVSEMTTWVH